MKKTTAPMERKQAVYLDEFDPTEDTDESPKKYYIPRSYHHSSVKTYDHNHFRPKHHIQKRNFGEGWKHERYTQVEETRSTALLNRFKFDPDFNEGGGKEEKRDEEINPEERKEVHQHLLGRDEKSFGFLLANERNGGTVEDLGEELNKVIRIFDVDEEQGLELRHYISCSLNSSETIKQYRGNIYQKKKDANNMTKVEICRTFGFTPEFIKDSDNLIPYILKSMNLLSSPVPSPAEVDISKCLSFLSKEGAVLRLYNFDVETTDHDGNLTVKNHWNLSTHRRINAFKSKWGDPEAKSYGDTFIDGLEWEAKEGTLKGKFDYDKDNDIFSAFVNTLDKNKKYSFIVLNTKHNRLVCDPPSHPQIYFIGSFKDGQMTIDNDTGIPLPPRTPAFNTLDQLFKYVEQDISWKTDQGVILYLPNQTQIKILNPIYASYFCIRGNERSIKFRYLQLRNEKHKVKKLISLYPEHVQDFREYEDILDKISREVHTAYVAKFIQQKHITVPPHKYRIMTKCHEWHRQEREKNKISLEKIQEIIDTQAAQTLNSLIKEYYKTENENIASG